MPKVKKQSVERRLKSKRTLMKKIRKNKDYHDMELNKNRERIIKLHENETYRLTEIKYKINRGLSLSSNDSQTNKTDQFYKSQLRKSDKYRLKENLGTLRRMTELRKNVDDHYTENRKTQERISQLRNENDDFRQNEREKGRNLKKLQRQDPFKQKNVIIENNSYKKKARTDLVSGPKLRQLEKEEKRKQRMNNLLRYRENYRNNLLKKIRQGNKSAVLYHKVLIKQSKTPEICTCCMRKLYDCINKLTAYKKEIILQKHISEHAYHLKESEFLCDSCWNCLRKGNISKIAATRNLTFTDIPDYSKRL